MIVVKYIIGQIAVNILHIKRKALKISNLFKMKMLNGLALPMTGQWLTNAKHTEKNY